MVRAKDAEVKAPKRRFFFPNQGVCIEADSYEEALAALEAEAKKEEVKSEDNQ